MDTERGARAGGAFAWKTGAWFGAQVGSTLWLVVLGIVLSLRDDSSPGTAIIAPPARRGSGARRERAARRARRARRRGPHGPLADGTGRR